MIIRTKIVATIGPATNSAQTISRIIRAGCDVPRINFSHGTQETRTRLLQTIRDVEADLGIPVAVMADLCGPKIRVGQVTGGSVMLAEGQEITIQRQPIEGRADRISTTLAELVDEVKKGESLYLDDGKIRLEVKQVKPPDEVVCTVTTGGILAGGKGVNLPQTHLKLPALTEKDRRDVDWIVRQNFDYVALSFVRSAADVEQLRKLLTDAGCGAHIIAKIEKPQALVKIEEIIESADAIMVARGDLGIEMDLPAVPVAQKKVARLCQRAGKCCIIATQMLESMTANPTPTRAEVSDVANAVLDHADAVMLSGETAVGKYPVETVSLMNEIVAQIQTYYDQNYVPQRIKYAPAATTAAIAAAVREIINVEDIAAVGVFTATGTTARVLAKNRIPRPVLAISPDIGCVRRMNLYYGIEPVHAKTPEHTRDVLALAGKFALERKLVKPGQKMVVVSGRPLGEPGKTNTIVVHTV